MVIIVVFAGIALLLILNHIGLFSIPRVSRIRRAMLFVMVCSGVSVMIQSAVYGIDEIMAGDLLDFHPRAQDYLIYICAASGLLLLFSIGLMCIIDGYLKRQSMQYRIESILKTLHPQKYQPDAHISEKLVRVAGLYPKWNKCKGSDLTVCEYRKISVAFSDLLLTYEWATPDSSGVEMDTVTVFQGIVIILRCDYAGDCTVRIMERSSTQNRGIQTAQFADRFFVKSNDAEAASKLLTPELIDRLLEADEHAQAVSSILLSKNLVFVMLHNHKDNFEFEDARSLEEYQGKCQDQMVHILRYIDILIEAPELFDQSRVAPKEAQGCA